MSHEPLDRRLHAARPDLADESLRGRVEAARFTAGFEARIALPSAPLRREPREDAPIDTEALAGERIRVFEMAEGHAWAQLEDGYVGYLPMAALGAPDPAPTHHVVALRSFIYPGPNLKSPPRKALSLGARVAVTGSAGAYAALAEGGFVFAGHLDLLGETPQDFVAIAEELIGTPYLWGGKTSLGLDCSGLVQLSMAVCGLAAPRDTDLQEAALGPPSPREAGLRRGDLVFWRGHVGIMRDEDRLLHANGHHMRVASEPLRTAEARILEKGEGAITSIRRPASLAGPTRPSRADLCRA